MRCGIACLVALLVAGVPAHAQQSGNGGPGLKKREPSFQTSDRCMVCHNGLTTSRGEDVSIGFEWRASIMANSSRDPYWQSSVRRETIDHPESEAHIEDECSICHMPVTRYEAKLQGRTGQVFAHLPFSDSKYGKQAADGVNCSVCHQTGKEKLGTRESFNGGFVIDPPLAGNVRPEYGPFDVDPGHQRIMRSSTGGFQPVAASEHIRQSEMCATCHTLYTTSLGPGGKVVGTLPEQTPFLMAPQRLQGSKDVPVMPHARGGRTGTDHACLRRAPRGPFASQFCRRELLHAAHPERLSRGIGSRRAAAGAYGSGGRNRRVPEVVGGPGVDHGGEGGFRAAAGRCLRR
jgi:hypothetical protein